MCTAQSREALCVCTAQSREALCVCTAQSREALCVYCTVYSIVNVHDRTITIILARHCIKLPDDGSLVIRNVLEQF